jgi:hypothetical protein
MSQTRVQAGHKPRKRKVFTLQLGEYEQMGRLDRLQYSRLTIHIDVCHLHRQEHQVRGNVSRVVVESHLKLISLCIF